MDVAFDHQIFSMQRYGGASRYFADLIRHLDHQNVGIDLPFSFTINRHLNAEPARHLIRLPLNKGMGRICFRLNDLTRRRRTNADIVHTTYYHERHLRSFPRKPMVTTVYDMTPELLPQYFRGNPHLAKRAYVDRATRVICISHRTKMDLVRLWDIDENKISVVHLGVAGANASVESVEGLPEDYLLFIGARGGYKNFLPLLQAYKSLRRNFPGLVLLCVGGGAFTPVEIQEMVGLPEGAVQHRSASDDALRSIMRGAQALIYPSLYEGFGLPIIEAMAQGCPTILAEASCLPEVGGDAARYFDPHSPDSIAATTSAVLSNARLADDLRVSGRARARLFSLEKVASETLEVYRECLEI